MQDLNSWLDTTIEKRPDLKESIEKVKQRLITKKGMQLLVEDEAAQLAAIEQALKEKFN